MKVQAFLSIVISTAVIGFIGLTGASNVSAYYQQNYGYQYNQCNKDHNRYDDKKCDNCKGNNQWNQGDYQDDNNNPTVSPTPSVSPAPTPVVTDESDNSGGSNSPCTQNCGNPPSFPGSTTQAPVCSNVNTTLSVANPFVVRNNSEATVNFFITEGNQANIYYKEQPAGNWQFAVGNLLPNGDNFISYTITDLKPSVAYDFGIQQTFGCGGGIITPALVLNK